MERTDYDKYLRLENVLKAILRAVDRLGIDKNEVCMVSGIGCSSRTPGYVDFNTLHTTHGRALTFATGVKMVRPDLHVIVVTGDGDATAIGGNHFIHAARRNIDITVLLYNNWIYGMTGGQASPSTPMGKKASTAPFGTMEHGFDIVALAAGAGASFVARETVAKPILLDRLIERAIVKKGFSLVEVMTPCPTTYGRRNKEGDGSRMTEYLKVHSVPLARADKIPEEEKESAVVTGVFVDVDKPEYTEEYARMVEKLRESKVAG
jgi:2-oxoglutarate ferredoxin oxidoreductase subunit beta